MIPKAIIDEIANKKGQSQSKETVRGDYPGMPEGIFDKIWNGDSQGLSSPTENVSSETTQE